MTDIPRHPGLQRLAAAYNRFTRLFGLLFALSMVAVLIFMMTVALHNRDVVNLLIFATAALVMLPAMALMGWLLWYLQRKMASRLLDADRLLREGHPVTVRLTPTGLNNKQGMLMAVQVLDTRQKGTTDHLLIEPSIGGSRPPRQEFMAQLYYEERRAESRLVALHEDKALLGKWVDARTYCRQMRWSLLIATIMLLVVAGIFVVMGVQEYQDYQTLDQGRHWAEASRDWPDAPGRIVSARLATARIPQGKRQVDGYWTQITFEYAVAGIVHRGDTPFFCNRPTVDRPAAEAWLTRYPVDAAATVYYDPNEPSRSVLQAGDTAACMMALDEKRQDVMFAAAINGFLIVIALFLFFEFRKYRRWSLRPGA